MDEEKRQAMALFRYGLIAPLVAETYPQTSKEAYYRDVSSKEYTLPNGDTTTFNATTIKKWFIQYKKYGLEGITPSTRIDAGRSRKLEESVIDKIREYRTLMPYITARKIYDRLIEEGHINYTEVSIDTIYRYLRTNSALTIAKPKEECLSFECLYAGDCWQADSSHGPTIIVDGKKVTTWLISFIDDASRLITHGEFFENDNAVNVQLCFKKAIAKAGLPRMLYLDNGSSYANEQLKYICAELGIHLVFTRPYTPKSHGKIERSHLTAKQGWMNAKDWSAWHSLEDVNESYQVFLQEGYNHKVHSSIGITPKQRYMQDYNRIRFVEKDTLEHAFLHRITRGVSATALVSVFNTKYEVPQHFIGEKRLELRYPPNKLEKLYIYQDFKEVGVAYPVKTTENAKRKRQTTISYGDMDGGKS